MLQEINCCYTSSDRKVKFISIWMKWDEKDKGGLHRLPVCWGSTKRPSSRRKRTPVIQLLHTHSSIPTHPNMAENKLFRQNISRFPRLSHFVIKKSHVCSAYLHRFKLMEHAICVCSKGDRIIDHLINQCTLLQTQRKLLKSSVLKSGSWPVSKHELVTKHQKSFSTFTNSIDFDKL